MMGPATLLWLSLSGPGLGPGHHGWVPADPQKVGFDQAKLGKAGEAVGRVVERCKEHRQT